MNITVAIAFVAVVHRKRISIGSAVRKIGLTTLTFALLFAWYWIPYVNYPVISTDLGREEGRVRSSINIISTNDPWDILLLERDRFLYVNSIPNDLIQSAFHYVSLAFVVGIAIVLPLFFSKKIPLRLFLFFAVGFFVSTLLALGTKGPLADSYFNIVTEKTVGWIFRSPLKFQLYQSFFVSALFGFSISLIRVKMPMKAVYVTLLVLVVVGVSSYAIYDVNVNSFNPISIPNEYYEINNLLAQRSDDYKVIYYPVYGGNTTWSRGHGVLAFDAKSTSVPTFAIRGNYNFVQSLLGSAYFDAITLDNSVPPFRTVNFYDFLSSLGIKYIVFHDDRNK
ncbi:MAG: hypothetical protein ACREBU_18225, partial [Nitrososphaera sp.]